MSWLADRQRRKDLEEMNITSDELFRFIEYDPKVGPPEIDHQYLKVLGSEQNAFFDVDDTMVMHVHDNSPADLVLYNDAMECNVSLNIHHEHVKQIKSHKNRGFSVFVWSGNGAAWAKKVIEALELQDYVDYYMTKPVKFFDDLPAEQVLVNRVYLPYKKSVD